MLKTFGFNRTFKLAFKHVKNLIAALQKFLSLIGPEA